MENRFFVNPKSDSFLFLDLHRCFSNHKSKGKSYLKKIKKIEFPRKGFAKLTDFSVTNLQITRVTTNVFADAPVESINPWCQRNAGNRGIF